jgi:hypothetical protein
MQSRLFRTVGTSLQVLAFVALVVGVVGCSSSRDSLLGPQPATPVFNLTGVWFGTLSQEGSDPIEVTWTANQSGNSVIGPLVFATPELGELNATLAGVITDGDQVAFTFTVGEGSIATAPTCSASGSGTSSLTDTEIAADIDISYGSDCLGVVTDEATQRFQLSLSRE